MTNLVAESCEQVATLQKVHDQVKLSFSLKGWLSLLEEGCRYGSLTVVQVNDKWMSNRNKNIPFCLGASSIANCSYKVKGLPVTRIVQKGCRTSSKVTPTLLAACNYLSKLLSSMLSWRTVCLRPALGSCEPETPSLWSMSHSASTSMLRWGEKHTAGRPGKNK